MIDFLLSVFDAAATSGAAPSELDRHLDGVGAIMENHFAFEERQLLRVLDTLVLQEDPHRALGGLKLRGASDRNLRWRAGRRH